MANVVARHYEVAALIVAPANHDVGVRMAGVEMIDRHPVEPCIKIAFHLGQQIADEGFEIGKTRPFIGRHHKAELVWVPLRSLEESHLVSRIAVATVETTRLPIAGDTVAYDVLEMGPCGAKITAHDPCVARLDDHTPTARRDQTGGGAHAGCQPTFWHRRGNVAPSPQGARTAFSRLSEHHCCMPEGAGPACIANALALGIKLVLRH